MNTTHAYLRTPFMIAVRSSRLYRCKIGSSEERYSCCIAVTKCLWEWGKEASIIRTLSTSANKARTGTVTYYYTKTENISYYWRTPYWPTETIKYVYLTKKKKKKSLGKNWRKKKVYWQKTIWTLLHWKLLKVATKSKSTWTGYELVNIEQQQSINEETLDVSRCSDLLELDDDSPDSASPPSGGGRSFSGGIHNLTASWDLVSVV